jgi:nicotinamide phosphoribosyltransferase
MPLTRDTYGFAVKTTYGEVNGKGRTVFKDPKTDNGTKKSAKGLLKVTKDENGFKLVDECSKDDFENDTLLDVVFKDGKLIKDLTLSEIRNRLKE